MAHTKPEMIADLARELDEIRGLDGIKEKSLGVFYYKSIPFMHFHNKDGERWADVKTPTGYRQVDIALNAKAPARRQFLRAVQDAHSVLAAKKGKK